MDPRERADAALARARARGTYVVTPESAISPMDAASTLQIPRAVVSAIDHADSGPPTTPVTPVDDRPAIAQEASTQSLPSPAPNLRKKPEKPVPKPIASPLSWEPHVPPAPLPPPEPEPVDGLVPTVKQPPTTRSSLSQRLDG
jgi:hypothetical protein